MPVRILLIALVLAACSQSGSRPTQSPDPTETPPTTSDPGAVEDTPQTLPTPPRPETARTPTDAGPDGPALDVPETLAQPDGSMCQISSDCASGICEGEGCGIDQPGRCVPRGRGCTRDLRPYCGCDGKTFRASGNCPLRRYRAKGACTGS